ncbi:hypothetical protein [Synechococcus sp. KORDI-52]|uniref:hypothetical protein n=1 Tax=Synechococcus sp. KORDI-52 TaxID=585425 RepID=UPI0012EC1852|nr:hypothetical protein [Synechococcus sp. KORDI-52]
MPTNKYRRRRAMRTPTAGTKYQNEPLQAPLQKVEKTSSFNDLGREDARRISEQNNPNTRYVDKPTATTSKRQLSDAMSRQQAVIRNAQRHVLGSNAVPQLKPSGSFSAPSIPQSQLVFKGGSVRFLPRTNLVTAVAGVASQLLVEPLLDVISDNIIFPLMEKALGRDIPSAAEIRRLQQQGEQVRSSRDAAAEEPSQALVEAPVPSLNAIDDAEQAIEDSAPLREIVEEAPMLQPHSPAPQDDERNREYLIRRAALGNNPTQEEMDAVVAYGLAQHRINFPHLY